MAPGTGWRLMVGRVLGRARTRWASVRVRTTAAAVAVVAVALLIAGAGLVVGLRTLLVREAHAAAVVRSADVVRTLESGGDPVADLGGLLAYWPRVGDVADWTFPVLPLSGFAAPAELAEAYAAVTGRDLTALPVWHALALWKIAIICEGVRRRALEDERNAARTGIPPASAVEDLVDEANHVLFGVGL